MSTTASLILTYLSDHIHHTYDDLPTLAQKMGVPTTALLRVLDRLHDYAMHPIQHNLSSITILAGSWVEVAQNAVKRMYVLADRSTLDTGEIILRRKTPTFLTRDFSSYNTTPPDQKYPLENQVLTTKILTQNLFERKLQRKASEKRLEFDQSPNTDEAATIDDSDVIDDSAYGSRNDIDNDMDLNDPLSIYDIKIQNNNSIDDNKMDRKINFPFLDPCGGSDELELGSSTESGQRQMETCVHPPDRLEKDPSLPESNYRFSVALDPYIPILQAYNLGRVEVGLPEYPINRATLLQIAWCAKQGGFSDADFLKAIHMRMDQYKHHQCGMALVSIQSLFNPRYLRTFLDWLANNPGYNPKGMSKTRVKSNYKPIQVHKIQTRHITQDMVQTLQHKPIAHRSQQEQAEVTAMYQSLLANLASKKMLKL